MFVQVHVTLERGSKLFSHVPSSASPIYWDGGPFGSLPAAVITHCGMRLVLKGTHKLNKAVMSLICCQPSHIIAVQLPYDFARLFPQHCRHKMSTALTSQHNNIPLRRIRDVTRF